MKNFTIQHLALTVLIVMVSVGSPKCILCPEKKHILEELICEKVENLKRTLPEEVLKEMIPRPRELKHVCVEVFFCMAEKALNMSKKLSQYDNSLVKWLSEYNKCMNNTPCQLNEGSKCGIQLLLSKILQCPTCSKKSSMS